MWGNENGKTPFNYCRHAIVLHLEKVHLDRCVSNGIQSFWVDQMGQRVCLGKRIHAMQHVEKQANLKVQNKVNSHH